MCKNQVSSKEIDEIDIENARVGYQAAINLWTYQGREIWARFNVMLVANSILIGVIGLDITNHPTPTLSIFSWILSFFGIFICLAWILLMKRSNDYQNYYVHKAFELEGLLNKVNIVFEGKTFQKGDPVKIAGISETLKMNKWIPSTRNISYFIIVLFIIIYLTLLHIPSLSK
jgi:hypothetical protein